MQAVQVVADMVEENQVVRLKLSRHTSLLELSLLENIVTHLALYTRSYCVVG